MRRRLKRAASVLAAAVLGATLTGVSPASAATSEVDCTTGGYTRVFESFFLTNIRLLGVDGNSYRMSTPATYEICLDIPDASTFTIEVQIQSYGVETTLVDDRPGDKIFHVTLDNNSLWQVYGTLTGPDSVYLPYTWYEKKISS